MDISTSLQIAKNDVLQEVHHCQDILAFDFLVGGKVPACLFFIDGMVNKDTLNRFVIDPMMDIRGDQPVTVEYLLQNVASNAENSEISTIEECLDAVLGGDSFVLVDGCDKAILIGAKGYRIRGIQEPPSAGVIKGPREGFTEDLKTNTILLRRKLKSKDLIFKPMRVGRYSNTYVFLAYLHGIADPEIVEKVENRLKQIDIDGILDSSYIARFLEERRYSIFRQIGNTEKPDVAAARLLEGRIAVFVDGSPLVLTLPFMLLEDFQSAQDYYERPQRASFTRIIRFLGIAVSVLLPAVYVAAQIFHLQLIPLRFLVKLMGSTQELSLSPALEMFLVLLIFEVLREASIRMPKYVGTAVSVVGALVLGETAVSAGIISTPSILIMALSGIAVYTVPDQEGTLSLLRIVFLILAGSIGMFGILVGVVFLSTYLVSLSSYGTPYLAPFAPLVPGDLKDAIFKKALPDMNSRPRSLPNRNRIRLKNSK